jgi:hypothetical protein
MAGKTQHKEIPFSGKFYTSEPATIGQNFQTLKNLRYTDTHIKGIAGMTPAHVDTMNSTYFKTRSAFHLKKSQPSESHIIAQSWNEGLTASVVLQNTAVIPATAAWSSSVLWTDTTAASTGRFSNAPDGHMIYANGVDTCIWGGDKTNCGAVIISATALATAGSSPLNPEDFTTEANNTKTDSLNVFTLGGSYKTLLLGAPRPAKGATFTLTTVNATANTLEVKESTAGVWTTISVTSDGTRAGGTTSFAQNGTISWASTVASTKPKYIEGYYLYWYQFTITDGSAVISNITLDLPFQPIIDMWDGIYRDIARFYIYTTSQADKSINVFRDDYYEDSSYTFADISSLGATTQYLECGFVDKQTGIYFAIPSGFENSSAAVMSVDYWDGDAYTTVGDVSDGTITGTASFAKSGVVSWNNTSLASEQRKQYANAAPLYYYRVKFDGALDASVRLNYVGGVTASKTISHYKFPIFAQGRVLLCGDMSEQKNRAVCSAKFMPQVYNSLDSVDIYFGEEGELTCGTELFSQFGSSLYAIILMFKDNETWIVAGQDIDQWESNTFLLSSAIGCPAPLTLQTVNLHAEPGVGINRALAIWQGANGVYMSDGRAPIPIYGDIKAYFDPLDSRCIKTSMIGDSVGFVDPKRQEYHLLIASGTSATILNTELVYDIARNKWFEIDRSGDTPAASRSLQCGLTVHDTYGNSHIYGFHEYDSAMIDLGYMFLLENGTSFDGNAIVRTVQFGDIALGGLAFETRLSALSLLAVAKSTPSNVTFTHYSDTKSSGVDKTMSQVNSGYRVTMPGFTDKFDADPFHGFKFTITTSAETVGFEPLAVVASFHQTSEEN